MCRGGEEATLDVGVEFLPLSCHRYWGSSKPWFGGELDGARGWKSHLRSRVGPEMDYRRLFLDAIKFQGLSSSAIWSARPNKSAISLQMTEIHSSSATTITTSELPVAKRVITLATCSILSRLISRLVPQL